MAFIYKITNLVNNKIYIGETTQTIKQRWSGHKYSCIEGHHGCNYHLHCAMRKYGIENFIIEEIEQCPDEERFEKESFYIQKFNSLEPNGYNYLLCGTGSVKVPIQTLLDFWNQGLTLKEISKEVELNYPAISQHLKANGITEEDIKKRNADLTRKRCSYKVLQYDLEGNFIKEWPSATSINSQYNQTAISNVCRQEQKSAYGYLWKYKNDDRPIEQWVNLYKTKKTSGKPKKEIAQIDKDNNVINIYESAAAAARALQINDKSNICKAARQHCIAYGFYWEYL